MTIKEVCFEECEICEEHDDNVGVTPFGIIYHCDECPYNYFHPGYSGCKYESYYKLFERERR